MGPPENRNSSTGIAIPDGQGMWSTACDYVSAELLPQIENSKRISVGRDRCQQHLSWVKCDPGGWVSPGQLLVVIVEYAGHPAAFDPPNLQALRITGSE